MRKVRRRRSRTKSRVRKSVRRSRRRSQVRRSRKRTVKRTVKRRYPKRYNEYLDYFRGGGCVDKSYIKKYATRPGPSYAAQDCKGEIRNGNDGLMYISVANRKNGVYRWQKL